MYVLCIDGSPDMIDWVPVQEHTVVLEEGQRYEVTDTFRLGKDLFYFLKGHGRNAYHSAMFVRIREEYEDKVEKLFKFLASEIYKETLNPKIKYDDSH